MMLRALKKEVHMAGSVARGEVLCYGRDFARVGAVTMGGVCY